jgi:hypothetical protein
VFEGTVGTDAVTSNVYEMTSAAHDAAKTSRRLMVRPHNQALASTHTSTRAASVCRTGSPQVDQSVACDGLGRSEARRSKLSAMTDDFVDPNAAQEIVRETTWQGPTVDDPRRS